MAAVCLDTDCLDLEEGIELVIGRYRDNGWGYQEVLIVLDALIEKYVPLANEEARQEQEQLL